MGHNSALLRSSRRGAEPRIATADDDDVEDVVEGYCYMRMVNVRLVGGEIGGLFSDQECIFSL
jgi:hypothetical protein